MAKTLPWFRLYTETVDDEKLRLLAFEDRWHFIAILCCKAQGLLDGDIDEDLKQRKLSVKLGLSSREMDEVKRRLTEVGLIGSDWSPLAWDSRQFKSDHDGAERQARHRQFVRGKNA